MRNKDNVIQEKSYQFALAIIAMYKELTEVSREFVLSKQLLKCGTSIGANISEAIGGQSKNDFIAKMSIAYKGALETEYWLNLLSDSNHISRKAADTLLVQCSELLKILTAIINTAKM